MLKGSSKSNSFSKAPPPHIITLGVEASIYKFWGITIIQFILANRKVQKTVSDCNNALKKAFHKHGLICVWDLGGTGEPPPVGWSGWASLGWDLRESTDLGAGGQRP